MKIVFLLFFLMPIYGGSQNLVPNPSFENYIECPSEPGQMNKALNWQAALETPDYFNECSPSSNLNNTAVDVPSNAVGHQTAANGNAYMGLFTFFVVDDYREYAQCQLTSSLEIGTTYFFSMKVSRAEGFGFPYEDFNLATNNLGVLFTMEEHSHETNPLDTPNMAHINFTEVVLDTNNWVLLSGQFIADQSYQYLCLGNFFDSTLTEIVGTDASAQDYPYGAYYLIDDVCLCASLQCNVITNSNESDEHMIDIEATEKGFSISIKQQTSVKVYLTNGQLVYEAILTRGEYDIQVEIPKWTITAIMCKSERELIIRKFIK